LQSKSQLTRDSCDRKIKLKNKNNTYQLIKPVFYSALFFCTTLFAQEDTTNLVPNGSFEELIHCPVGADIYQAKGWFSPTSGTPDLYNSCANLQSNLSVPSNGMGFQYAENGVGYAGIVSFGQGSNYREYLAIKLKHNLVVNHIYEVKYYVSLAEKSPYASNNMGFAFSTDSLSISNGLVLNIGNYAADNRIITDSLNWTMLNFYYVATGNEKFLIVGNFINDNNTLSTLLQNNGADQYYFLDDVSVKEFSLNVENVFTPNHDGVNDVAFYYFDIPIFDVEIYNRWGNLIRQTNTEAGWDGTTNSGIPANEGVYFYRIINRQSKIIKTGFIQLDR